MSDDMLELDYPDPKFIAEFAKQHRLAPVDVVRDIVRLAAIHQMTVDKKYFSDQCVLCGGVAMRFYGSNRFTIMDTDSSYRLDMVDEIELERALKIDTIEDVTITPADGAYWTRKGGITTAKPVHFIEEFSQFQLDPKLCIFKLSVSSRGLIEPAVWKPIVHDYPSMGLEDTRIPLMDINEQLAEKILGWSANGLTKHYLDCAWIISHLTVDREVVVRCLLTKLAASKAREPSNYERLNGLDDFRAPLESGDRWTAPINPRSARAAGIIRYVGPTMTMSHAQPLVRSKLIPLLWPN